MSRPDAIDALVSALRSGEMRAIARAIRIVEERDEAAFPLLTALHPYTGHARILGVTGTPGAGKSTLVDRLVEEFRIQGRRIAVLAVDPSSPYSGGAILGDRIRMQRHFTDPDVFIRSLATRGHLGGLARAAGDAVRVLDAARFDLVLIETVGVGQDELEIAELADTTLVVVAPGLGDDVQAIKAGILEIASIFVVNKADREGSDAAVRDLEQMLVLGDAAAVHPVGHSAATLGPGGSAGATGWVPPVLQTVASTGRGVRELAAACEAHRAYLTTSGALATKRKERVFHELRSLVRERVLEEAWARLAPALVRGAERVAGGDTNPYTEADTMVDALFGVPRSPRGDGVD